MTHELAPQVDQSLLLTPDVRRGDAVAQGNPVFQILLEDFKQRIHRGEWLPGERLPSIIRLAKDREVSTGSVREALRSLQSLGLVKIEHGRGVFVTGSRPYAELTSQFETMSIGLIVALAETRRLLEPELAALAAERGTNEELAEIDRLSRQMEEDARQGLDFAELDVQFHRRVAQAARNPILYRMMESVNDLFLESRKITSMEPGMTARAVRYHLLIAEALCDRNASQARLLMLAHMNDMLSGVLTADAKMHQVEA
jgi:GntR family transcriptional repressor for pyruvate dehydrogenase complex